MKKRNNEKQRLGIIAGFFKMLNKISKILFFTFFTILMVAIVTSSFAGIYVFKEVMPMVEEARETSFDSLLEINAVTFEHYKDTQIFDKNGDLISEINVKNYEPVNIQDVSTWVYEGYIAVEDKNFKVHPGVDYFAIARAAKALVENNGVITQGGSTITQQVVKNAFLNSEKKYQRKATEFFLAQELEKEYNKAQIMEYYVNMNFYGNNCYGIETASQYYFGKPSSDLEIHEAALFVGISNNASFYNPLRNPEGAMNRRNFALEEMFEEGVITENQYYNAITEPFDFVLNREAREPEDYMTSYALHDATLLLMKKNGFEFKYTFADTDSYNNYKSNYREKYGEIANELRMGGYKIYTQLDPKKQAIAQEIVQETLSYSEEKQSNGKYALQGSIVLANNDTGFIEVIVGGRDPKGNFNRGFLAVRQPGSAIKPLVAYTPAYDTGEYYPSYHMIDRKEEDGPNNYDFKYIGAISLREALGRSKNTIAFNLLGEIGPNTGLSYLEKMQFSNISPIDNHNGALALGGFTYGVKAIDMVRGYKTLVNGGIYEDKGTVTKIEHQKDGEILNENVFSSHEVYSPQAAYMGLSTLLSTVEAPYGLSRKRAIPEVRTGSKSGTTNSRKDAWFVGFSPKYSLSTWVGYDTPKNTGTSGSGIPGEMWEKFMNRIYEIEDLDKTRKFVMPNGLEERTVDFEGYIVDYETGSTDLFTTEFLENGGEEKLRNLAKRRIAKDNSTSEYLLFEIEKVKTSMALGSFDYAYSETKYNSLIETAKGIKSWSLRNDRITEINEIFEKTESE